MLFSAAKVPHRLHSAVGKTTSAPIATTAAKTTATAKTTVTARTTAAATAEAAQSISHSKKPRNSFSRLNLTAVGNYLKKQ